MHGSGGIQREVRFKPAFLDGLFASLTVVFALLVLCGFGLLRQPQCGAFRPGPGSLLPFHLAHPPLSRVGGAPFLGALLEKDKDYRPAPNLKETAAHLAATERTAMAAERDVMDGYKIAYLSRQAEKLLCGTMTGDNQKYRACCLMQECYRVCLRKMLPSTGLTAPQFTAAAMGTAASSVP
jgi:hypothetical protein